MLCSKCGKHYDFSDLHNEIADQADFFGMDSLTENQQCFLDSPLCLECYFSLETVRFFDILGNF